MGRNEIDPIQSMQKIVQPQQYESEHFRDLYIVKTSVSPAGLIGKKNIK